MIQVLLKKYNHFIVYSIIGVSGVALDMALFVLLSGPVGLNHQVANIISTSVGITNNFLWNTFTNFKTTDRLLRRYVSFYLVGMVGLALTAVILYLLVDLMAFDKNLVKAASIVLVVIVQYSLNKRVSFKSYKSHESKA